MDRTVKLALADFLRDPEPLLLGRFGIFDEYPETGGFPEIGEEGASESGRIFFCLVGFPCARGLGGLF